MHIGKWMYPEDVAEHIIRAVHDAENMPEPLTCVWEHSGHADERHIDVGENYLIARLISSNQDVVTSFPNREDSERKILKTIESNAEKIANDFCDGKWVGTYRGRFASPVGFGLTKEYEVIQSRTLTISVRKDSGNYTECGFVLKTAYPGGNHSKDIEKTGKRLNVQDIVNNKRGFALSEAQRLAVASRVLLQQVPDAQAYCYIGKDKKPSTQTKIIISDDPELTYEINMNRYGIGGKYKFETGKMHDATSLSNYLSERPELAVIMSEIDQVRRNIYTGREVDIYLSVRSMKSHIQQIIDDRAPEKTETSKTVNVHEITCTGKGEKRPSLDDDAR